MTLRVSAYSATDPGRRRKNNEDAFLVDGSLGLYVVADGMGGQKAGEVASNRAVAVIRSEVAARAEVLDQFAKEDTPELRITAQQVLEKAIQSACAEVHRMSQENPAYGGMGTTVVAVIIAGEKAVVANVGDSRVYLLRAGQLYRLTEDHTLVATQLKAGIITREEATRSPLRNVLIRAVGNQPSVQVDTLLLEVLPADRIVLCTDGLHGYLDEDPQSETVFQQPDAALLPTKMIELANGRGGRDNITVVVAEIEGEEQAEESLEASTKLDALGQSPLFKHLTYKEQIAVLGISRLRTYRPGEDIVIEGDPMGDMYLLLRGRVSVLKGGAPVASLLSGSHFGEMGLVDEGKRSATVRALIPTRALVLPREDVMNLMKREPVLAVKLLWAIVQVLSERLRHADAELSEALGGVAVQKREVMPFSRE